MPLYISITMASLAVAATLMWLGYELVRDLMMFQQNSYRPERFMRWIRQSGASTSWPRLIAVFVLLFSLSRLSVNNFDMTVMVLMAVWGTAGLARRRYKKPLVWTGRVKRLFAVMAILTAGACCCTCALFAPSPLTARSVLFVTAKTLLGIYCLSLVWVMVAAFVLKPVENAINRGFYRRAQARLQSMPHLRIIGITGSYGKTSTKHYLHRLLSERYETLMTPGSFNTTLGVVRTVNEHLRPTHRVFIVEMGAKQTGDIARICDLVHPTAGIVTAVGPQHLETFKTIDNVLATKMELVDSLPSDGLAILNDDSPMIAGRTVTGCRTVRYTLDNGMHAQCHVTHMTVDTNGTTFTLDCDGHEPLTLTTRLLGDHNIADLTAAVICALDMGLTPDEIKYAVATIEPVEHRLSVRRHPNGLTVIDDAFNSNPVGSRMAVDVLGRMQATRRIVITPGMIELGEEQHQLNRALGQHIAGTAHIAMIVGDYNRPALTQGLEDGGMDPAGIMHFNTFLDANAHLLSITQPGDVVLIENDLPDTFK